MSWITFFDERHFWSMQDWFSLGRIVASGAFKFVSNHRVVILNMLAEVSKCASDIAPHRSKNKTKQIDHALLIYDWRLDFFGLEILFQFPADKYWL